MKHSLIKILACTSLILGSFSSRSAHAVSNTSIATGICITATAYLLAVSYGDWVYESAIQRFSAARTLLNSDELNASKVIRIKQEIFRAHDAYCKSYLILTPPYKNYPLVWYVTELKNAITRLSIMHWLTFWSRESFRLIADLEKIYDLLITDYDVIKERRKFEQANEMLSRTYHHCH